MKTKQYGYQNSYIVEDKFIVTVEDLQIGYTRFQILEISDNNRIVESKWFNDGKTFGETERIAFEKVRELLGK